MMKIFIISLILVAFWFFGGVAIILVYPFAWYLIEKEPDCSFKHPYRTKK